MEKIWKCGKIRKQKCTLQKLQIKLFFCLLRHSGIRKKILDFHKNPLPNNYIVCLFFFCILDGCFHVFLEIGHQQWNMNSRHIQIREIWKKPERQQKILAKRGTPPRSAINRRPMISYKNSFDFRTNIEKRLQSTIIFSPASFSRSKKGDYIHIFPLVNSGLNHKKFVASIHLSAPPLIKHY